MMFLAAVAVAAFLPSCVPVRWFSGDPKSLDLLAGSPVKCLIVAERHWTSALVEAAHVRGMRLLSVNVDRPGADAIVFEGDRSASWAPPASKPYVIFGTRAQVRASSGVVATGEGVWPGIRIDDHVIATPTTSPWIDTNLGVLRYLASRHSERLWIANTPPPNGTISPRQYEKAYTDAALAGARWVISVHDDFAQSLLAGSSEARTEWDDLMRLVRFFESQPRMSEHPVYSKIGVSMRPETGAYVSGGVLDMIGAQHIPFRIAASGEGFAQFFDFADNRIVHFPKTSLGRTSMAPGDADQLEVLHRRIQVTVGRNNYGLRVFNGVGLLSTALALKDSSQVVVLLANYTDFPAEDITLHVMGSWDKAVLESPMGPPQNLATYPVGESTAVEVPRIHRVGLVRLSR